jgi:hypothetical protein
MREDPNEPCAFANVWTPAAAWADREQFTKAVERIIGGDPRSFSLDYVDLVPHDAIDTMSNGRWME